MRITNYNDLYFYIRYTCPHACVMWGFLLELFVMPLTVLMFLLRWLLPRPLNDYLSHDYSKQPVVLIHGSGSNEMQWLPCLSYLRNKYNVYTIQLNKLMGEKSQTIEQMSNKLEDLLFDITVQYNKNMGTDCEIILVGHSMGGLVASWTAEITKCLIARVITINTPHNGVPLLDCIDMGIVRHNQMTHRSEFLIKLRRMQRDSGIDYICYGSDYDFQVPAYCAWARKCKKIKHNYSHTSAIFFQDIWQYV